MHELCTLPATELAAKIRAREVTVSAVLEAHIARIERVNPLINAVVVDTFEDARREARAADRLLTTVDPETLPPFFGVPFTVKELIAVQGLPWTAGVVARAHVVADEDAPQVQRLRAAGAIVIGTTNVSECGLWLESSNKIYGRTRNPWDLRRMAGGSTGGEAAIIAAGGSPMGLGADIGGSIRNPCFFNGICGHKPSGGLLPAAGHWPPAPGRRARYCVTGPMGRTIEDLTAMMEVLSLEDDPYRDADQPRFQRRSIQPGKIRVFTFEGTGLARVSRDMKRALSETASALEYAGFQVEEWAPSRLNRAAEIWGAKLAVTGDPSVSEFLGNGQPISLLSQWARWPFRRANHSLISLIMASGEALTHASESQAEHLIGIADEIRAEIEDKLGDDGVLMFPVYPRSAPRHHAPLLSPLAFSFCGIVNVLELPGTAVPTGFDRRSMPLGVQIVGPRFGDSLTLAVAKHVEAAWGGWRPAPLALGA